MIFVKLAPLFQSVGKITFLMRHQLILSVECIDHDNDSFFVKSAPLFSVRGENNVSDEKSWKLVSVVGEDDVEHADEVGRPHVAGSQHLGQIQ
jgi:hypothetical protein